MILRYIDEFPKFFRVTSILFIILRWIFCLITWTSITWIIWLIVTHVFFAEKTLMKLGYGTFLNHERGFWNLFLWNSPQSLLLPIQEKYIFFLLSFKFIFTTFYFRWFKSGIYLPEHHFFIAWHLWDSCVKTWLHIQWATLIYKLKVNMAMRENSRRCRLWPNVT